MIGEKKSNLLFFVCSYHNGVCAKQQTTGCRTDADCGNNQYCDGYQAAKCTGTYDSSYCDGTRVVGSYTIENGQQVVPGPWEGESCINLPKAICTATSPTSWIHHGCTRKTQSSANCSTSNCPSGCTTTSEVMGVCKTKSVAKCTGTYKSYTQSQTTTACTAKPDAGDIPSKDLGCYSRDIPFSSLP
ncbi:MAG: hypothetical protein LBH96_02600 [Candidatus Peribacteria bacterium]|jgi:hypothetical protein|nr:hypothetical protein [Candidatus Peribacteria bacterium]